MSILHSPLFLALFFTFPVWGFIITTLIDHRFGENSLTVKAVCTAIRFLSVIPLLVAGRIFFMGSYWAAENWTSIFINTFNLVMILASLTGPAIMTYDNWGDEMPSHTDFIHGSIFFSAISIIVWYVVGFVLVILAGACKEVYDAIILATRQ